MDNKNQLPVVVIFGRTNVGKSTLFNCLTEKNKALVSKIEGTTRDSNVGQVEWGGIKFTLVDTGGIINIKSLIKNKKTAVHPTTAESLKIDMMVQKQARDYLTRACLILFLVDVRDGLLPQDRQLALFLKKFLPSTGNILLAANKADSLKLRKEAAEFNQLALGKPLPVSAGTGVGTGDLLDVITEKIKTAKKNTKPLKPNRVVAEQNYRPATATNNFINIAIIGQPNVGKSSLVNAILGEKKIIVSPTPHTTREPQDAQIKFKEKIINLIDTAGISKSGQKTAKRIKNKNTLEKFSITKSLAVLKRADIALLIIDIHKNMTRQDAKLTEEIIKKKTSLIIVANKWDLVKEKNTKLFTRYIYRQLPFATWAPIQFTSALTGAKVKKILDLTLKIYQERKIQIRENTLNKFLTKIVKRHKPAKAKGTKHPRIYELKQINTAPPRFLIRIGPKDTIHFSYIRFIENRLREKFGFLGTPLTIKIEKNRQSERSHRK